MVIFPCSRIPSEVVWLHAVPRCGLPMRLSGQVTSATFSPRLGRVLALAIVKDSYREPGTRVEVAFADAACSGTLVALSLA